MLILNLQTLVHFLECVFIKVSKKFKRRCTLRGKVHSRHLDLRTYISELNSIYVLTESHLKYP